MQSILRTDPFKGAVFVFRSKRADRLKLLWWDGTGLVFAIGHDECGKAGSRIGFLIETAKINCVKPLAYLKATLEATATGHPTTQIDDLLPWNFKPPR